MATGNTIPSARRLILHCGVQKTASTSLQRFLWLNRDALAPQVEVLTPIRGSLVQKLGRAAMRFSLDPTEKARAHLSGLCRDLAAQLAQGRGPVLVSHENLLGAMPGKDGVTTLYPRMEQIIALLGEHLAPLRPEIVTYSRDMADWKHSVYNQAVRSDRYARPRADFEAETGQCGSWTELHDRITRAVEPAPARAFRIEDEPSPERPGQQLLRFAGVEQDAIDALVPIRGPANPSLNSGATEFLRLVNGLRLDRPAHAHIAALISANQALFVAKGQTQ